MARCGCGGGGCTCTVRAGTNVTVSGTGSAANPYKVSAEVPCPDVRACLTAINGVSYDQAAGRFSAHLSAQPGNNLVLDANGGLFVPSGAATVNVGCGLSGDGSASKPLKVNTSAWPYACSPQTAGGVITCDATGVLRGEPRGSAKYFDRFEGRNYNDLPVPAGTALTTVDTFTLDVVNDNPCRPALLITVWEMDVLFDLPAGAGAAYGASGDEMYYTRNTGSSLITDAHVQTTKLYRVTDSLAPGATSTISVPVSLARGSGGATYHRINSLIRAILIAL